MGKDIHLFPGIELHRTHMIEVDEGADHALLTKGEKPAYEKLADIGSSLFDDQLDIGHREKEVGNIDWSIL